MPLDPMLLEILACPQDKGPLLYFEDEDTLYNPRLRRRYSVHDGIPVMLVDEAEDVPADEHERLLAKAADQGIQPTFETGSPGAKEPGEPERPAAAGSQAGREQGEETGAQ